MGWPEITDLQSLDANNGIGRWSRYVSPDGRRQDTAHAYLHPKLQDEKHPNLHVLVESKVVRVLFDENKRAVGVEYTPNPDYQAATSPPPKLTIMARKLVVVSCGACGTPAVLERSGLGDPVVLERAGLPVVVNLPSVGREYLDHHASAYPYKTSLQPHETIDGILSGRTDITSLIEKNDKILGWNAIDVAAKLRPTEADIATLDSEFQDAWDRDFKNNIDKPLMLMGLMSLQVPANFKNRSLPLEY